MKLSLIAAIDEGHLIGAEGGLPWHLPADMKNFRAVTMGKPIIMGRTTHESIGKPLDGRDNIIITRNTDYTAEDCTVVHSVEDALKAAQATGIDEAIVIGGGQLYNQTLEWADRLYLTLIRAHLVGDTHFPDYSQHDWQVVSNTKFHADDKNAFDMNFIVLDRIWE